MFFLYLKSDGKISLPVIPSDPDMETLAKESVTQLGSGIKWENVDVFYAPDEEFPEDFREYAPQGKYYVEDGEIKETPNWVPPEEEEWI